jgi:hypothetical protein
MKQHRFDKGFQQIMESVNELMMNEAESDLVMISDLDDYKAYFTKSEKNAKDKTDKDVYNQVMKSGDTITMGKVVGTPARFLSRDNMQDYKKYGIGRKFEV